MGLPSVTCEPFLILFLSHTNQDAAQLIKQLQQHLSLIH